MNYLYFFPNFQNLEELLKNFYASSINDKRLGNDYFLIRSFLHLKFVDMSSMKIETLVNAHAHKLMIFLSNCVITYCYRCTEDYFTDYFARIAKTFHPHSAIDKSSFSFSMFSIWLEKSGSSTFFRPIPMPSNLPYLEAL